jgi:hypothetical protein
MEEKINVSTKKQKYKYCIKNISIYAIMMGIEYRITGSEDQCLRLVPMGCATARVGGGRAHSLAGIARRSLRGVRRR